MDNEEDNAFQQLAEVVILTSLAMTAAPWR